MSWISGARRDDIAARLRARPALAGIPVQTSRPPPIAADEMPIIVVYADEEVQHLRSEAGSEPAYTAKLTVAIELRICAQAYQDAEAATDAMIDDVTSGLLQDPTFIRQYERIPEIRTNIKVSNEGADYLGLAQIAFTLDYVLRYPPETGAPFRGVTIKELLGKTQAASLNITFPEQKSPKP